MLPDWPQLKREIWEELDFFMKERHLLYLGAFSESPRQQVFEGRSSEIIRPDGEIDETEFKTISAEFSYDSNELSQLTLGDVLRKLDGVAKEMAEKFQQSAYEALARMCDKHGNTIEGKGEPLSPDLIIESWEKIMIPFDPNGRPRFPTLHIDKGMAEVVQNSLKRLEEDPKYRTRVEALIESKRQQWNAREADRKLVG